MIRRSPYSKTAEARELMLGLLEAVPDDEVNPKDYLSKLDITSSVYADEPPMPYPNDEEWIIVRQRKQTPGGEHPNRDLSYQKVIGWIARPGGTAENPDEWLAVNEAGGDKYFVEKLPLIEVARRFASEQEALKWIAGTRQNPSFEALCIHCSSKYITEADERGRKDCLNCGGSFQEAAGPADPDDLDPESRKQYALKYGRPPHIKVAYAIITPESSAAGAYAEHGWEDEVGEQIWVDPDEDDDEFNTVPMQALKYLEGEGATEPSSSSYHPGIWYTARSTDPRTGNEKERSFHLYGFAPKDEEEIFRLMTTPYQYPGRP